jgi:hypothetical protein
VINFANQRIADLAAAVRRGNKNKCNVCGKALKPRNRGRQRLCSKCVELPESERKKKKEERSRAKGSGGSKSIRAVSGGLPTLGKRR